MDEPLESRLRLFRETRSYESLLWAARAAIGLSMASVVLPLLFRMFPEPVPIAGVMAILGINWFIALLVAIHGIQGLFDFQRAGRQGRREILKAVAPMIKRDLLHLSR